MSISTQLVHRLHMSPVSAAVRRIPLVRTIGREWWIRTQSEAFTEALRAVPEPKSWHEDEQFPGPNVPSRTDALAKLPPYVTAGEEFSAEMATFCSTSKFASITQHPLAMGYSDVYAPILAHLRGKPIRVLEVGIGVNDPDSPSGMSATHQPGASLRGWAGYFPGAEVHGADVDRRCLIDTDIYTTHFVDQLDPLSMDELAHQVGPGVDLIVDDGLHTPEANANTIKGLLPLLSPSGVMTVEDIASEFDPLWEGAGALLPKSYLLNYFPSRVLRQYRGGPAYEGGLAVITRAR